MHSKENQDDAAYRQEQQEFVERLCRDVVARIPEGKRQRYCGFLVMGLTALVSGVWSTGGDTVRREFDLLDDADRGLLDPTVTKELQLINLPRAHEKEPAVKELWERIMHEVVDFCMLSEERLDPDHFEYVLRLVLLNLQNDVLAPVVRRRQNKAYYRAM